MTDTSTSLLDRRVGVDAVVVSVGGVVVPPTLTTGYRVTQGRTDPTGLPVPGVARVELRTDALPQLPRLGDELVIELGADALAWGGLDTPAAQAAARVRFRGHLTDQDVTPGRTLDAPGTLVLVATTAAARLGRTRVGDTPWPAELDGERAAKILERASTAYPILTESPPGAGLAAYRMGYARPWLPDRATRPRVPAPGPGQWWGYMLTRPGVLASPALADFIAYAYWVDGSPLVDYGDWNQPGELWAFTTAAQPTWPLPPVPLPQGLHDVGTVTVLARDVDSQPAAQLLAELQRDARATLVELRDGRLVWHDADHRQGVTSSVELTSANLLRDGGRAVQRTAALVNDADLGYGPKPVGGGDQARTRRTDAVSSRRFGPFGVAFATQLADAADADALAYRLVGQGSIPRWDQPGLAVELLTAGGTVTPAQRTALLQLQPGDLVTVAGMPAAGPWRRARLWCEGWTETVTRTSWQLQLVAGDFGRGGPPPRWADVAADVTWADVDPDVTWWAAVAWAFGEDNPGRWLDLPARQRWDQLDPALTWADV